MTDTATPTVTIDGTDYNLDSLSEQAKAQLTNLRVVDQEIARLQMQLAIHQTARGTYAHVLQTELAKQDG